MSHMNHCYSCDTFLCLIYFHEEEKYFCGDCYQLNIKSTQTILPLSSPKWLPQVDGYFNIPKPLKFDNIVNEDYYQKYLNSNPDFMRIRDLELKDKLKMKKLLYQANYYKLNKNKIVESRKITKLGTRPIKTKLTKEEKRIKKNKYNREYYNSIKDDIKHINRLKF